jgi:hypothetical protein
MYYLSKATLEDFDVLLALKSQKDAIRWSGFKSAPDKDSFLVYYKERVLANPKTQIMFLHDNEVEGAPIVGYIQYDVLSIEDIEMRGSVIKKSYQGTGAYVAMSNLLAEHLKKLGYKRAVGWVSEKNSSSLANSRERGWEITDEYEIRYLPLLGGEHRFLKCIKTL